MTLMSFPGLRPKTDNFSRVPGPVTLLICLFGPLACGLHHIPIELWLPRNFPRTPPLLFLTPSVPMRGTSLVDATNGRVHHPILQPNGWRPELGLPDILRTVASVLAMDPPFYPGTGRPITGGATGMSATGAGVPRLGVVPMSPHVPTPPSLSQLQHQAVPPPPPYGAVRPAVESIYPSVAMGGGHLAAMMGPSSATAMGGYATTSTIPPRPGPSQSPSMTSTLSSPASLASPASSPTLAAGASATVNALTSLSQAKLMLRERMNVRFRKLQHELALEGDRLLAENTKLEQGERTLREHLVRLQSELGRLEGAIEEARRRQKQLRELAAKEEIHATEGNGGDEGSREEATFPANIIAPTSPLARQAFRVHSEVLALEDLIYALSKAFQENWCPQPELSLAMYLRHVRDLARELFLARALLSKIHRKLTK